MLLHEKCHPSTALQEVERERRAERKSRFKRYLRVRATCSLAVVRTSWPARLIVAIITQPTFRETIFSTREHIYISMVNGGSTHVGRFSISGVIRTVRGEPRALVSWQSGGGISGRLLRNARTKLLLGYFPYCSPCALVFLPRFFVSSALMIFHVGTVLYRDLNGAADALVVKFSRRTVCRIWHTLVTVLPMCNNEERGLSWFENRN